MLPDYLFQGQLHLPVSSFPDILKTETENDQGTKLNEGGAEVNEL